MDSLFQTYANELVSTQATTLKPEKEVDAFEFITSPLYLSVDPTAFQRLAIKTFYGLWGEYPPDAEEEALIQILARDYKLTIDIHRKIPISVFLLVLGRRGTKSSTLSFFATYAMYSLICKGNPQDYYHIMERHPIHVMHVAAKADQAEDVFSLTSNNMRKTAFFRPYIDFDKNNSTQLRLFTPFDLALNNKIRQRNKLIPRGMMKEAMQPGSLMVESITTSAATNRGKAVFLLMLSELAHFQRAKMDSMLSEEQILSENPQSDYAIAKALIPSVKDFGDDGRVVLESSPREKGGEFYRHYCIGGGMDQEDWEHVEPEPSYQVIQLATWEARPTITRAALEPEFRHDPVGANMEYGARFGNPSAAFIPESLINAIPQPGTMSISHNPGALQFFICIDPGGKAKKKVADTYAVGWAHCDYVPNTSAEGATYWIDGLKGFNARVKSLGNGRYETIPVNPNDVMEYVLSLINDLGGSSYIREVCYDQFDSTGPVATLQGMGIPALETTFTNPYKADMYGDFLQKAERGQVKMYGVDAEGWVERWRLEMKYLQREFSGKVVYYHHPSSGPVQNDDFPDVVANLVHRMCQYVTPTKESIKDARKHGMGPVRIQRTVVPARGRSLWGGNLPMRGRV